MKGCMFNIDNGYLEGLCRGFKCGILQQSDYLNLVQCETLEGIFNRILFIGDIFFYYHTCFPTNSLFYFLPSKKHCNRLISIIDVYN